MAGLDPDAWAAVRMEVVERGNYLKFTQGNSAVSMKMDDKGEPVPLRNLLLGTEDRESAETSRFDRVWGIGLDADTAARTSRSKWGLSLLGEALTNFRDKIRSEVN